MLPHICKYEDGPVLLSGNHVTLHVDETHMLRFKIPELQFAPSEEAHGSLHQLIQKGYVYPLGDCYKKGYDGYYMAFGYESKRSYLMVSLFKFEEFRMDGLTFRIRQTECNMAGNEPRNYRVGEDGLLHPCEKLWFDVDKFYRVAKDERVHLLNRILYQP